MSTTLEIKSERTGYCRICQCYEDGNMFDMLQGFKEVMANEDKLQSTCEVFTRTTGIKISLDDELLRFVCEDCFTRLKDFLLLRQQGEDSRRKLTALKENQPLCLICMDYAGEMTDILSDIPFELDVDYERKLSHIFEDVVGISPLDYGRRPKLLCGECINRLIRSGMLRYYAIQVDNNSLEESSAENMIEIKQETINCQLCLKEFAGETEYDVHLPCTNQTTSDPPYRTDSNAHPYACKICLKTFAKIDVLTKHLHTHDVIKEEFACPICSKAFNNFKQFKEHSRIHGIERPFVCQVCSESFEFPYTLNAHINIHEGKPWACPNCPKFFTSKLSLRLHSVCHNNDRPHVCEICSKSFKRRSNLYGHKKIHAKKRSYKCKHCSHIFTEEDDLKVHLQLHSSERK